jgi:hypothetical protein
MAEGYLTGHLIFHSLTIFEHVYRLENIFFVYHWNLS